MIFYSFDFDQTQVTKRLLFSREKWGFPIWVSSIILCLSTHYPPTARMNSYLLYNLLSIRCICLLLQINSVMIFKPCRKQSQFFENSGATNLEWRRSQIGTFGKKRKNCRHLAWRFYNADRDFLVWKLKFTSFDWVIQKIKLDFQIIRWTHLLSIISTCLGFMSHLDLVKFCSIKRVLVTRGEKTA